MSDAAFLLIGAVVGAVAGLLPKVLDLITGSSSDKQEEDARLRMMLAGTLMSCVQSTNEFLEKFAQLRLDQTSSAGAEDEAFTADPREAVNAAFDMKTAWMNALISFGDPSGGKEPLDDRRGTIQRMLTELDDTYRVHEDADRSSEPERIIKQLQKVAALSRSALQELIGLSATP
jgi:hypothetical protein